jgi:hypothetical protein
MRHISSATSQDLGPSSTSARMWQWMSITLDYSGFNAI